MGERISEPEGQRRQLGIDANLFELEKLGVHKGRGAAIMRFAVRAIDLVV